MLPIRDNVPSRTRPVVMYALVLANVAVFLYEVSLGGRGLAYLVSSLGVVPARFTGPSGPSPDPGNYVDLFTAMFLHGSWLHLIGNMWYLWLFGDNVEDRMGHWRFLLFYLLGGVVASVTHILLNPGSTVPTIGASGAIAAVLGAYLVMFPTARILTFVPFLFFFVIQLPAVVVLGGWFLLQLVSGLGSLGVHAAGAGIAFWAHVGGFIFGLLTVYLFARRVRPLTPRVLRPGPSWPEQPQSWWPT